MDILILICGLLLFAYLADISAKKTKIPSIIFLIAVGLGLKEIAIMLYPHLVEQLNIDVILPVLGNLGLVLIVLEGAIELELSRKKLPMLFKTITGAFVSIIIMSLLLAYLMKYLNFQDYSLKDYLINIIPLTIISSAIAIPASRYMHRDVRELIIYESSFSDIFGVLIFYFLVLNNDINTMSFIQFGYDILIMLVISLVSSFLLSLFLSKMEHHVKFIPIIIVIVLIYSISKMYHLPSLILILIFGLSLKNLEKLSHFPSLSGISHFFHPEILNRELKKFEDIVNEFSFLVRTAFFIIFGASLNLTHIFDTNALQWSLLTVGIIYLIRFILLWMLNMPLNPMLLMAPRGLISILLFLSVPVNQKINIINHAMLVQVVLISTLIMMVGSLLYRTNE